MESLLGSIAVFVILAGVIIVQNSIIKRLEARLSDLLDRLTAPDFHVYQQAREREQRKMEVVSVQEFMDKVEPDGLRID